MSLSLSLNLPPGTADTLKKKRLHNLNTSTESSKGENDHDLTEKKSAEEQKVSKKGELEKSSPLLLVDLERLCGYAPSTLAEKEQLEKQVEDALLKDDLQKDMEKDEPSLPQYFDERAEELFDSGMADHSDTLEFSDTNSKTSTPLKLAAISYPEFLFRRDTSAVLTTARVWEEINSSQDDVPQVAKRLMNHLARCNRSLIYKFDLYTELMRLVREEQDCKQQRFFERELLQWQKSGRKQQLDKLYQVRETFVHKMEVAQQKWHRLVKVRKEKVQQELVKRQVGLVGLDLNSPTFAINDNGDDPFDFLNTGSNMERSHIDEYHQENYLDEADYTDESDNGMRGSSSEGENTESVNSATSSECDEDAPVTTHSDAPVDENEIPLPTLPHIPSASRARSRKKAAAKKQKKRLVQQAKAARLALERTQIEETKLEEARISEELHQKHTTVEERRAEAVVRSLEGQMERVEELLESLQEEEWAEEEEGSIAQTMAEQRVNDSKTQRTDDSSFSLLDQILAMVLGTLPMTATNSTTQEQHFQYIRNEHRDIVKQWKDFFGRLPSSTLSDRSQDETASDRAHANHLRTPSSEKSLGGVTPVSPSELRSELGIQDNEDGEWDDDEEEVMPFPSPKRVGLRPGGTVKRP